MRDSLGIERPDLDFRVLRFPVSTSERAATAIASSMRLSFCIPVAAINSAAACDAGSLP